MDPSAEPRARVKENVNDVIVLWVRWLSVLVGVL